MNYYLIPCIVLAITIFLTGCFISVRDDFHIYFLDEPCIRPHYEYTYVTCEQISVLVDHEGIITALTIPQEFVTDLASIPRWLWSFIAPTRSDFIGAAILHDYLYSYHSGFTRYQVDQIFFQSLIESGTAPWRAYQMYFAVRIFGEDHFDSGSCHEGH